MFYILHLAVHRSWDYGIFGWAGPGIVLGKRTYGHLGLEGSWKSDGGSGGHVWMKNTQGKEHEGGCTNGTEKELHRWGMGEVLHVPNFYW